jgi:hypothetical protein
MKAPLIAVTILGGVFTAGIAATSPTESEITEKNVFAFYRTFERLTKQPRRVQPSIATLCTTPTAQAIEAVKNATGLHHEALVHIYANALATEARTTKADSFAFPAGAVIIKEKLGLDDAVIAVGGMRKRSAGFDPANGDWEYFYATRLGAFSIGKLANCTACHSRAKETDYVFRRIAIPKQAKPSA